MHQTISEYLTSLTDSRLEHLLRDAESHHSGIGGNSHIISIADTSVFVKRVPITGIELQPENVRSTKNIFELPNYYHYGVGSTGFGAWHELEAHLKTTHWVLNDSCPHFPILYHWRVLPHHGEKPKIDIEKDVTYWEGNAAIRKRLEALQSASHDLVLFLQYIPHNLYNWLFMQLKESEQSALDAVKLVEEQLSSTVKFMQKNNFIHFDAHFWNLLCDGKQVYFSDFGLSTSLAFDLSHEEKAFFNHNQSFDQAAVFLNLLHTIITTYYGHDEWIQNLKKYIDGHYDKLSVDPFIQKYADLAFVMDGFYMKLQKESKETAYPARMIGDLLKLDSTKKG